MTLVSQFREFLGSVKTSETLTPELRRTITVRTGLENTLASALRAHCDVIIAGSAGGGKTHLISSLQEEPSHNLSQLVFWNVQQEPDHGDFVRVVADATALPAQQRMAAVNDRPTNCVAVAIAINEGPLLRLARDAPGSLFDGAVKLLHDAQRGIDHPYSDQFPTVLDVGGYDPIDNHVISNILGLPIFDELIQNSLCQCEDERICPRRLAWAFLRNDAVRERVNDLLRVVNMLGQPVLFREIWDFVSDIALGGSCQDSPPTSPWFWRVFYGSSELSKRLTAVADPLLVVYPRAEAHIWYGDWNATVLDLQPGLHLVSLDLPLSSADYRWVKSQMFFLVGSSSTTELLRDQVDLQLTSALQHGHIQRIVSALNTYMTYGTIPSSEQVLTLWVDMGVERRQDRPEGQVALGQIETDSLAIRRSYAVANHPDTAIKLLGGRYFLVHRREDGVSASFALTPQMLNLLRGGRSYRTSNRPHTDVEWHIGRFFSALATYNSNPRELAVLRSNFETRTSTPGRYRLSEEWHHIEPVEGA